MALLIASSASTEQWIFTGGRFSSSTICEFLIASASSTVLPLIHSVASDELAMAEPQPKVLNLRVLDDARVVDLDLQAHHVAAGGRADQARADVRVALVERADVLGVLVVLDDLRAVRHDGCPFSPLQ